MKSVCVVLEQSGLFLKDMTYFSKSMHVLPFSKFYIVHLSMLLCRFQDAKYCYGILHSPHNFHY